MEPNPSWNLGGSELECTNNFEYLGAVMSEKSSYHTDKRITSCRRSFYSIQNAGKNCNPHVVSYLWKAAIQPCLTYANECIPLRKSDIQSMDKIQAKLIKCSLGLSKYSFTSPLLSALHVKKIVNIVEENSVKILKRIMYGNSRGRLLYFEMMKCNNGDKMNLLSRVRHTCTKKNVSFISSMLSDVKFRAMPFNNDGLVDSLKQCFENFNARNRELARLLLSPRFNI